MSSKSRPRGGRSNHGGQSRTTQLSKALSLLLRHRATQDGVPISPVGFVRISDALSWHRLKSLGASAEDVFSIVEQQLRPGEKGRFGVKWETEGDSGVHGDEEDGDEGSEQKVQSETEQALAVFATGRDVDPAHFLIRAVQGHSLKLEDAEDMLTPITLAAPDTIPETVVHGTFYGAWERILKSGGLKPMGRVYAHFATGPGLREVLPGRTDIWSVDQEGKDVVDGGVEKSLLENKVRSGMRSDAQILIYINIRRALEAGLPFWKSENGVVLTEGIPTRDADGKEVEGGEKMLGTEFWDLVVEVKEGLGIIWRQGNGLVKELPENLRGKGMPRGKDGGRGRGSGGGRGRGGGKPRLMVERDEIG